jgi:hypothetical protein
MKLKHVIAGIMIVTGGAMLAVLLIGAFASPAQLAQIASRFTGQAATPTVQTVYDEDGNVIENATVKHNADGTNTVITGDGTVATQVPTSNGAASPTPSGPSGTTVTTKPAPAPSTTPRPSATAVPSTTPKSSQVPTPTPSATPKPSPSPVPAPTYCSGNTPCYGAADLAGHASTSNCWSYNKGVMFNLSGYASRHPAGTDTVLATNTCGRDMSTVLSGSTKVNGRSHNHSSSVENNGSNGMSSFKVGYYDSAKP